MKSSIYVIFSVSLITLVLGIGIGYYLTPEYQFSMYDKTQMDFGTADRWIDARYINAMIAHHRGAILLAEQAEKNGMRDEIKNLAVEIQANEPKLIAELYEWKKAWYGDTRTVRDPIVARLGARDEKFDLRFLNALIAHHESGVLMTKEIRIKSSRTEILNNADAVESFLVNSGAMVKEWRKNWYSI
ncbi:MAG: DUF305 domain-containing protein [Patescibacteria group bacterium]